MKKVVIFECEFDYDVNYDFNLCMWRKYLESLNKSLEDKKYKLLFYDDDQSTIYTDSDFIKYDQDLETLQVFIIPEDTIITPQLGEYLETNIPDDWLGLHNIMNNRECPLLIEVIETADLGKYNCFKVVEVPKDLEYYIGTYSDDSDVEVIIEAHRRYSSQGLRWVGK